MDFAQADRIVEQLGDVLQAERRIGGRYIALEWLGPWSTAELIRALYLVLAQRYRDDFPLSRTSDDFDQFASLIEGSVILVLSQVFPMTDLATLDRAMKPSTAWWEASSDVLHLASEQCRLGLGTVDGFAAWLKSVDPTFDDFLPMVNDHIDHHRRQGSSHS